MEQSNRPFRGRRVAAAIVLAGLFLWSTGGHRELLAQSGAKKADSVVKVTASADKADADGKQVVVVTLTIDKDWHAYANPVILEDLASVQTTVKITSQGKPAEAKIEYPKGKLVKDPVVGDYAIYEGKVEIKAAVRRAKGETGPLEVSVLFQACNDTKKLCLMAATVKLTVP